MLHWQSGEYWSTKCMFVSQPAIKMLTAKSPHHHSVHGCFTLPCGDRQRHKRHHTVTLSPTTERTSHLPGERRYPCIYQGAKHAAHQQHTRHMGNALSWIPVLMTEIINKDDG